MYQMPIKIIGPTTSMDLQAVNGELFLINQNFDLKEPPHLVAIDGLRNAVPLFQCVGIFNKHTVHDDGLERGQIGIVHRPYWSEKYHAIGATALFYPQYAGDVDAMLGDPKTGVSAEMQLRSCRTSGAAGPVYDLVADIESCDPCGEPLGGGRFLPAPMEVWPYGRPSPVWAELYARYIIGEDSELWRAGQRAAAALDATLADLDNESLALEYRRAYKAFNAMRVAYFKRVQITAATRPLH